ncbi:MAG: acyltransferase [Candidatus Micrarchaeia archaeon]
MAFENVRIHSTAEVSPKAKIGAGTSVWNWVQVRENAVIGRNCVIGKGVSIDFDVRVGDNCKLQNNVSVYHGTTVEDGVFVGPHVVFTNDFYPRAVNPDGSLKKGSDWVVGKIRVKKGASIGANATIVCGHGGERVIGEWALVGAGSVVTHDVPSHGLVVGNPARLVGFVCKCGWKAEKKAEKGASVTMKCLKCGEEFTVKASDYSKIRK